METFMSGAIVIEAALLSFLLALWVTWVALRGLFQLMPVTSGQSNARVVQRIRFAAKGQSTTRRRDAA
jgi:hypothetical protein